MYSHDSPYDQNVLRMFSAKYERPTFLTGSH